MIIYTASDQSYADSVINHIDPTKEFFKYRLYRHNCVKLTTEVGVTYVKDLRIIRNIPLSNIVIIDNSVLSFAFQLDNGIPILPFYNNKEDVEMESLKNYLKKLSKCENLTISNGANFNLRDLLQEAKSSRESGKDLKEIQTLTTPTPDQNEKKELKPETKIVRKQSILQTKIFETMENAKKSK